VLYPNLYRRYRQRGRALHSSRPRYDMR